MASRRQKKKNLKKQIQKLLSVANLSVQSKIEKLQTQLDKITKKKRAKVDISRHQVEAPKVKASKSEDKSTNDDIPNLSDLVITGFKSEIIDILPNRLAQKVVANIDERINEFGKIAASKALEDMPLDMHRLLIEVKYDSDKYMEHFSSLLYSYLSIPDEAEEFEEYGSVDDEILMDMTRKM